MVQGHVVSHNCGDVLSFWDKRQMATVAKPCAPPKLPNQCFVPRQPRSGRTCAGTRLLIGSDGEILMDLIDVE